MNPTQALSMMLLTVLLLLPAVKAQVRISQVLYDPINTESGGEAVELHNAGNESVNISGYTLATEVSQTDAILLADAIIPAGGYYLIADAGWSTAKDNPDWPNADHEETIGLNNADSGVAIISDSIILDAVGWGDPAGIDEGLWEGTPASLVSSAGRVLLRSGDTDDNSVDFNEAAASWHNSSWTSPSTSGGSLLTLQLTILNSDPSVSTIIILSDDLPDEGIQLSPVAKGVAQLRLSAEVFDPNGADDISWVEATAAGITAQLQRNSTLNSTHALYTGTVELPHYLSPGQYETSVTAYDYGNNSGAGFAGFTYQELLAMEIDATTLALESAGDGVIIAEGDESMDTPEAPTIRNTGNVQFDLRLSATDLIGPEATIPADNIGYRAGNAEGTLLNGAVTVPLALAAGPLSVSALNITVDTSGSYPAGAYTGTVELSPVMS